MGILYNSEFATIKVNMGNNAENKLNVSEIKLLSANPEFYKTFAYKGFNISVYINVKEEGLYYLVLTTNRNKYYIKHFMLDKIDNVEDFKQYLLIDLNSYLNITDGNVPMLSNEIIQGFVRDKIKDFIYNPQNLDTKTPNYPLFYFVDCKNHIFIAYNKKLLDAETTSKYKYMEEVGCLCFLSNAYMHRKINIKNTAEMDMFINLGHKTRYLRQGLLTSF